MQSILETRALTKRYGTTLALNNVDISLPKGKIVGLLGPNGSGKTTLLKIVAGLLTPTNGVVLVEGQPVGEETKSMISFLPENNLSAGVDDGGRLPRLFRGFLCGLRYAARQGDALPAQCAAEEAHEGS